MFRDFVKRPLYEGLLLLRGYSIEGDDIIHHL